MRHVRRAIACCRCLARPDRGGAKGTTPQDGRGRDAGASGRAAAGTSGPAARSTTRSRAAGDEGAARSGQPPRRRRAARRCACSASTARAPSTCARHRRPVESVLRRLDRPDAASSVHADAGTSTPCACRSTRTAGWASTASTDVGARLLPDARSSGLRRAPARARPLRRARSALDGAGSTVITGGSQRNQRCRWPTPTTRSTFWTSVATYFKNDPMVIFDLFNEPILDSSIVRERARRATRGAAG